MSDLDVLGSSNGTINSPPTSPNLGNGGVGIEISPFQPNESVGQTASHNYRHSRAYRHFKNPPQPHMCIRTTTIMGDELFINVLSWTRIVIPQEPSDPIPLYGGMRVPPGSPRCPPLVYAVMANPEVLKDSGRHSKDPEERRAMVELMCDFVEAMNADVKLTRNAIILKDRDISGELKDVWNAVQAQRDREREEQITQQQRQQQQHYHNVTTQQMFPKIVGQQEQLQQQQQQQQLLQNFQSELINSSQEAQNSTSHEISYIEGNGQENSKNESCVNDNKISYMDFDPETAIATTNLSPPSNHNLNDEIKELKLNDKEQSINSNTITEMGAQSAINSLANINFTFNNKDNNEKSSNNIQLSNNLDNCNENITDIADVIDNNSTKLFLENTTNQLKNATIKTTTGTTTNNKVNINNDTITTKLNNSTITNSEIKLKSNQSNNTSTANNSTSITISTSITTQTTNSTTTTTTSTTTPTPTTQPTKKEKLGGFLPNGCIFPRFKNNKHKEKDKDNTKSSSNKEKTLLNSLKKVTSPSNKSHQQQLQQQQQHDNKSQQYDKNCINLENEVEKLDLNKLDSSGANDMVIKVKVASSGAK